MVESIGVRATEGETPASLKYRPQMYSERCSDYTAPPLRPRKKSTSTTTILFPFTTRDYMYPCAFSYSYPSGPQTHGTKHLFTEDALEDDILPYFTTYCIPFLSFPFPIRLIRRPQTPYIRGTVHSALNLGCLSGHPLSQLLYSRYVRQETTQKLKKCLISQWILAPAKALINNIFETYPICLSSTQYRLSDGVPHINSQAHNIEMKIVYFYTMQFETSLNVDSLIGSKLPKIELTCLTTIIGLEIYLEHRQLQWKEMSLQDCQWLVKHDPMGQLHWPLPLHNNPGALLPQYMFTQGWPLVLPVWLEGWHG